MKLAAPVQHPFQPGQILLKCGYVLEQPLIPRLLDLGVRGLFVEFPDLADLDVHLAPLLSPARQRIYQQIKLAVATNQRNTSPGIPYADYYATTRDLIGTLLRQGCHPLYLDQMSRMGSDAVGHATAVSHLSLVLGIKLHEYLVVERQRLTPARAKEIVALGVAGMMHDLGKSKLPEHLRDYSGIRMPTDELDLDQWEEHPRLGYDMIRDGIEAAAAAAVLHHHQHFDGTGFPKSNNGNGISWAQEGKKIHIFPRIIQAADLYDRLSTREDGSRRPNVEIHHMIRSQYLRWLDPKIHRALEAVAPPFPPGTRVTLSDGTCAVVMKIGDVDPYHPIVRRVQNDGWSLGGNNVDLKAVGAPSIVEVGRSQVKQFMQDSSHAAAVSVSA
jgi:HD-GYP domain-containing protein (c-di-GMP phosphodiesterase class II)